MSLGYFSGSRDKTENKGKTSGMESSFEKARRAGIDISLIEENLLLRPEQRLLQHQRALNMLEQLRSARRSTIKQQGNDQPQQHPGKTV